MKWYLDFGHGGKDPGAIGPTNLKESDVALKIGMIIKENLENALEKVITTREDDKYYSLDYRTKKANNENCDYFISIHLNSATNSSAKGCEVWLYNENIKLKNLANNLCNNLSTKMDTPNRGVKYSKNLSVLKNTKMPSLLIEIDFISNKEVENNLRNDNHLKNIADTISSTLLSFVNKSIVEDKVFYRVCIGSFSNKDNAVNLKNEAICKGFKDTHIYTTYKIFIKYFNITWP